ncbi:restriction endonuclease subunit S domain-containing protein, partial [Vibrio parahaemolyticus]
IYSDFKDCSGCKVVNNSDFKYRQVKVGLNSRKFEYEKVPFNVDVSSYLSDFLSDIHEGYEIDRCYVDEKDNLIGKVGVEFSFDIVNKLSNETGKQFRYYFKEGDDSWDIAISKKWNKVIFKDSEEHNDIDKVKYYYFSLNFDFDIDYLKYFFNSDKWKSWLITYNYDGVLNSPNKYSTLRKNIYFPDFVEQQKIASILDETAKWKQRLATLESDLWMEEKSDYNLELYKLPVEKDLHSRVIELAPYPFANIMHHYGSISECDYK